MDGFRTRTLGRHNEKIKKLIARSLDKSCRSFKARSRDLNESVASACQSGLYT